MHRLASIRSGLSRVRSLSSPLSAFPVTVTIGVRVLDAPSRVDICGGPARLNSHYTNVNNNNADAAGRWGRITAGVLTATGLALYLNSRKEDVDAAKHKAGEVIDGLPTYTKEEVAKHKTTEDRIWITYRRGVYDITEYVPWHKGGSNIMWGAGRDIDPIWKKFSMHNRKYVYELLEKYRIGNLAEEEDDGNVNTSAVQVKDYKLDVSVDGAKGQVRLGLNQLKTMFPKKEVTATLKCERNKRSETVVTWSGATLEDVLKHSGVDLDKTDCEHIQFTGMDKKPDGTPFGASIPVETVRELRKDIIVAYAMNGAEIPADQGYPVRLIVPRAYANKQVKCLNKITLTKKKP